MLVQVTSYSATRILQKLVKQLDNRLTEHHVTDGVAFVIDKSRICVIILLLYEGAWGYEGSPRS